MSLLDRYHSEASHANAHLFRLRQKRRMKALAKKVTPAIQISSKKIHNLRGAK